MSGETPVETSRKTARTKADWFSAAEDVLVAEGVEAIRIDHLCQQLDVTKGSFYWHFPNRAAFLSAFLADWRDRTTLNVIEMLSQQERDPETRLVRLLSLPDRPKAPKAAQVEQSLRAWARTDATAQEALADVDQRRLMFFRDIFAELGFAADEADRRARLAYTLMLGDTVLRSSTKDADAVLSDAVTLLLAQPK